MAGLNRQSVSQACYCITPYQKVGGAQNLYLGATMLRGTVGAFTQTSQIERPALLQSLNLFADDNAGGFSAGTITEVTIGGQSIMVSDSVACLASLRPINNFSDYHGSSSLGISVNQQMTVVIQGTTVAAANVGMAVALDPLPTQLVKTRAEQATNYNVIFGTGQVNIPAIVGPTPGQVTSVATSNRACTLGSLIIQNNSAVPTQNIVVSSLKVSGLELLAGATGIQEIPLAQFAADSASSPIGGSLGYEIPPMARVEITYLNYDAAIATVCGTIFCLPWTTQKAPQMAHSSVANRQTLRRLKRG